MRALCFGKPPWDLSAAVPTPNKGDRPQLRRWSTVRAEVKSGALTVALRGSWATSSRRVHVRSPPRLGEESGPGGLVGATASRPDSVEGGDSELESAWKVPGWALSSWIPAESMSSTPPQELVGSVLLAPDPAALPRDGSASTAGERVYGVTGPAALSWAQDGGPRPTGPEEAATAGAGVGYLEDPGWRRNCA